MPDHLQLWRFLLVHRRLGVCRSGSAPRLFRGLSGCDRPGRVRCLPHYLLTGLLFLQVSTAGAQEDSTQLYRNIHDWANKRKVTKWIYDGIFVPPRDGPEPAPSDRRTRRVNPFLRYAGKVVRHIEVRTFDPFGFSVDDTTQAPVNWPQRWANRLHRRTRPAIARNVVLVREGEKLDPLKVSESERLLRAQPYVNDARIEVLPVPGRPQEVDLVVLVHDRWSVVVHVEGDLAGGSVRVEERNVLGWGHLLSQRVGVELGRPKVEYEGEYAVYNIARSYASASVKGTSLMGGEGLGVSLSRPFYSPLARWAGGMSWTSSWAEVERIDSTLGPVELRVSPATLDVWGGRSFMLDREGGMAGLSSSYVAALRYAQVRYPLRPAVEYDTLGVFRNSALYLGSVGLSIRQYYKERFLFRFGASEDVPEGLLLRFVGGGQRREAERFEPYLGVEGVRARSYDGFGYLSLGLGYGTFIHEGRKRDGTIRLHGTWFSDLNTWGRWHFRQFVRMNLLYGIAKPAFVRTDLGGEQLYGFDGITVRGSHKEVLNLEAVFYAPYKVFGFRFAPVLMAGLATVGEEADPLFSGRVFAAFGAAVLVRNENLLANTFEVSLGFYPWVPPTGSPAFRFNNFGNWSARVVDPVFPAPSVIGYE